MRAALLVLAFAPSLMAQNARAQLHKRVTEYLEPVAAQGLFSGAVLLARSGEVLFEGAYGVAFLGDKRPNTVTTRFKLMSISKTLTSALVMRLVQEGKMALSDRVSKHVPDWPASWSAVTLHDLLDHTSGIPYVEGEWTAAEDRASARGKPVWAAFAPSMKGKELLSRPGTESKYSNFNLELAGIAVEYVSGQGFRSFLGAKLLAPLGMEATGFDDGGRFPELAIGYDIGRDGEPVETTQDMSRIQAACGLYSTVGDLYKLDRALRGRALIDPALHKVMVTPRVGEMACSWVNQPMHGRPCYRHSGRMNGYSGDFLRFPEEDATVIVLSNQSFGASQRGAQDLAAILLGKKVAQPQKVDAATLQRCVGSYEMPGGHVVMHRYGDKLAVFRGEGQFFGAVVLPIGNGLFAEPGPGDVRLEFEAPPSKRARRLIDGAPTTLQRTDAAAKWKALVGVFDATPTVGKGVSLVAVGEHFALQIEGWPPIDVVPLSDSKALAIYEGLACTTVHRDGNSLRLRINASDFRLDRRAR
jgi:D-alanyl-D-alanine carboxypeptidase